MAVKMMSLNSLDKQFIDDNMLTEEDFLCAEEPVELSQEDIEVFEEISRHYGVPQTQNRNSTSSCVPSAEEKYYKTIDDFINVYMNAEAENCKNSSSFCSIQSQDKYSPMSNSSVVSIPEETQSYEMNGIVEDTPPHTPPGSSDNTPDSSFTCIKPDPVIVTLNSVPQVAYVVSNSNQPLVKPLKPPISIKPKLVQSEDTQAFISNGNGNLVMNSASNDPLVKLPTGVYQVKSPKCIRNQKITDAAESNKRKLSSNPELVEMCEAALKRQTRIMKNRESATISRMKKKEYVEKLEANLNKITAENSSLRDENNQLKLKIINLEKELSILKATFSSKGLKKTACLMVALFIMTINIGPFSNIFEKVSVKPQKEDMKNHRVGRILLWSEENRNKEHNASKHFLHNRFMNEVDSSYIVSWEKSYNSSCHHFINKTESLRLENDLLGWVKRVEKKQKLKESHVKSQVVDIKTAIPPLPKLQLRSKYANENNKDIWAKKKNKNEILIYHTPRKDYEDFFDAIHRRDDSFYFVSFSGDHLLLPAIAHNQTLRPRMSFVMPAMTLNDSIDSDNYISMMQIDCEVMDTKLVYIKESVIPPHLRQKHNNTSKSNIKTKSRYSVNKSSRQLQDS